MEPNRVKEQIEFGLAFSKLYMESPLPFNELTACIVLAFFSCCASSGIDFDRANERLQEKVNEEKKRKRM